MDGKEKPKVVQDTYGMKRGSFPKSHPVPKLEELISTNRPDIVIVQNGTNLFDLFRDDQTVLRVGQFVVGRRLVARVVGDHLLGDEGKDHDEQDRESRALEKTPHREKSAYQGGFGIYAFNAAT